MDKQYPLPIDVVFDMETRSTIDLKKVGLYKYAKDPTTDILCMSYRFTGDTAVSRWLPGEPLPARLIDHILVGGLFIAHNAQFEFVIWNTVGVRYGWPKLLVENLDCTMVRAYNMGLPGGLEDCALALGVDAQKDMVGRALMLRMARPRRYENGRPIWWTDPDKMERLYAYCDQDVIVTEQISSRLLHLSKRERKIWHMDIAINQVGVPVDTETAYAGIRLCEHVKYNAAERLSAITSGEVTSPTSLGPLRAWCAKQGVITDSLAKEQVESLLASSSLPPQVREALEIRQAASKASVAKLNRVVEMESDDRLHYIFQYYGAASTGRWAGRGVQPHNMIRDVPSPDDMEDMLELIRSGDYNAVGVLYGEPMSVMSRCMRGIFRAPDGHLFCIADYNAIEGRGTAWVSGEQKKLDAFAKADRREIPGIYESTAGWIFHKDPWDIKKDSWERFAGKVCELAFGYQGGVAAARKFLPPEVSATISDREIQSWKYAWREAHPNIVKAWAELESAAIEAVRYPGMRTYACNGKISYCKNGSFLFCELPSGRFILYPYPKLMPSAGWAGVEYKLTYMTNPNNNNKVVGDLKNSNTWARVATFGGHLMENVSQALCRDILADHLLTLHMLGQQNHPIIGSSTIVMHVHDEIVVQAPATKADQVAQKMQEVMTEPPMWAPGFPLSTEAYVRRRYGK